MVELGRGRSSSMEFGRGQLIPGGGAGRPGPGGGEQGQWKVLAAGNRMLAAGNGRGAVPCATRAILFPSARA